jgi:hypothetical protein
MCESVRWALFSCEEPVDTDPKYTHWKEIAKRCQQAVSLSSKSKMISEACVLLRMPDAAPDLAYISGSAQHQNLKYQTYLFGQEMMFFEGSSTIPYK